MCRQSALWEILGESARDILAEGKLGHWNPLDVPAMANCFLLSPAIRETSAIHGGHARAYSTPVLKRRSERSPPANSRMVNIC